MRWHFLPWFTSATVPLADRLHLPAQPYQFPGQRLELLMLSRYRTVQLIDQVVVPGPPGQQRALQLRPLAEGDIQLSGGSCPGVAQRGVRLAQ